MPTDKTAIDPDTERIELNLPQAANERIAWPESLGPSLIRWARERLGPPSLAQAGSLPLILEGNSVLLSSPTGSGKTLAAFLGIFRHLELCRARGEAPRGISAIYVSPLRALGYDIRKNLEQPLAELGWDFIKIGVRTGDTPAAERSRQRRLPPDILVTTPESLLLMLSQSAWHSAFQTVRYLVLDEIHSIAGNKRGVLWSLAAEWLETLCRTGPDPLIRIGLSATAEPLSKLAGFLAGNHRRVEIISCTDEAPRKIEVLSPLKEKAYPPAGYTGIRILTSLRDLILRNRTTLIFCNTRSGAESTGLRLKEMLPRMADSIEVHHASLDRNLRLEIEDRLKRGDLRAVVCSTSLEMGIDIGSIDTVVMIAAPKGVARALQRLGRSGHSLLQPSHGVLVATNCNDLIECTVTARMMDRKEIEPVQIPEKPLDVLAQFVVAVCCTGETRETDLHAMVCRAIPYRDLSPDDFARVLQYLQGGGRSLETRYRNTFGKILRTKGAVALSDHRQARQFYQNIGTISSDAMVTIRWRQRNLGQVEESFLRRMRPGDVLALNGRCFRLESVHILEAKVQPVANARPTIPRWNANKMPLSSGLAAEVVRLRTRLREILESSMQSGDAEHRAIHWLQSEYRLSSSNANAVARHAIAQQSISRIPGEGDLLIEYFQKDGQNHIFLHSLIGRSGNDALSRILVWRWQEWNEPNAVVTIDDYGILLTQSAGPFPDDKIWLRLLTADNAWDDLQASLAGSELVKWQFRGVAQTGLMVPRSIRGEARRPRQLQWSSEILYEVLRRHEPDHPLLEEAVREATHTFLDFTRAKSFLEQLPDQSIDVRQVARVSPFAFGLFASRIREVMIHEDPESLVERLFHEMYHDLENGNK